MESVSASGGVLQVVYETAPRHTLPVKLNPPSNAVGCAKRNT